MVLRKTWTWGQFWAMQRTYEDEGRAIESKRDTKPGAAKRTVYGDGRKLLGPHLRRA